VHLICPFAVLRSLTWSWFAWSYSVRASTFVIDLLNYDDRRLHNISSVFSLPQCKHSHYNCFIDHDICFIHLRDIQNIHNGQNQGVILSTAPCTFGMLSPIGPSLYPPIYSAQPIYCTSTRKVWNTRKRCEIILHFYLSLTDYVSGVSLRW